MVSYVVLYCNRFIILLTQIIPEKTNTKDITFLILQYSSLKSTAVEDNSWHAYRAWHQVSRQEELLTKRERKWETAELKGQQ